MTSITITKQPYDETFSNPVTHVLTDAELYWNDNQGNFSATDLQTGLTHSVGASAGPSWSGRAVFDANNDGNDDLVIQRTDGEIGIWETNGNGGLIGTGLVANSGLAEQVVGVGNFEGSNSLHDILTQNTQTGAVSIDDMNGLALVQKSTVATPGSQWHVEGVADFNGDGKSDILLQNSANSQVGIWEMDNGTIVHSATVADPVGWKIVGVATPPGQDVAIELRRTSDGELASWAMNTDLTIHKAVVTGVSPDNPLLIGGAHMDSNIGMVPPGFSNSGDTQITQPNGASATIHGIPPGSHFIG